MTWGSLPRSSLPGERVLWQGPAGGGILFQPMDFFLVPFSILWCGFAVFWEVGATGMGAPASFDLFGAVFVCFGLYFVFGRFLADMMLRRSLHYTVTSRRVLIERDGLFSKSISVSLADAPPISLRRMRGDRGTIKFGETNYWMGRGGFGAWSPAMDPAPQLLAIDDAQHVYDLIQRTQDDIHRGEQRKEDFS